MGPRGVAKTILRRRGVASEEDVPYFPSFAWITDAMVKVASHGRKVVLVEVEDDDDNVAPFILITH